MDELSAAGDSIYSELKNLVVWAKTNGGMGTFYRSRHELIFVYKVGTAKHLNADVRQSAYGHSIQRLHENFRQILYNSSQWSVDYGQQPKKSQQSFENTSPSSIQISVDVWFN